MIRTRLLATLEEHAEAYCSKDIDRLMALIDDGDDISLIGAEADERCAGRAEIKAVTSIINWTGNASDYACLPSKP